MRADLRRDVFKYATAVSLGHRKLALRERPDDCLSLWPHALRCIQARDLAYRSQQGGLRFEMHADRPVSCPLRAARTLTQRARALRGTMAAASYRPADRPTLLAASIKTEGFAGDGDVAGSEHR